MTIAKMPLTCANIGMGELRPQILDTAGPASLNRVTSITAQQRHDERPAPGRPGPSRWEEHWWPVLFAAPRGGGGLCVSPCWPPAHRPAAIDAPRPLSDSPCWSPASPSWASAPAGGDRESRSLARYQGPGRGSSLTHVPRGWISTRTSSHVVHHQSPPAHAVFEQGGAPANSSNLLRRQICNAYGPLFRFLAPWW